MKITANLVRFRNKGSAEAAAKFREVNAAYEVLGNFRLKKLYDKGILHTAGSEYADQASAVPEEEDDAQTKFYKQRLKRSEAPRAEGESTIYDFDKWARDQYKANLQRKQENKAKFDRKAEYQTHVKQSLNSDRVVYFVLFMVLFVVMFSAGVRENSSKPPAKK